MNKIHKLDKKVVKVFRAKETSFNDYNTCESTSQSIDFAHVSQASAIDLLIDRQLKLKVKPSNMLKVLIKFVEDNDVCFKNYATDKKKIIQRISRHFSTDTLQRLEKRAIQLT